MPQPPDLAAYVYENSAHESGHITILFKARRLVGLNFLPHEVAANKIKGVLETDTGTQLTKDDCVALAGGMAGELIYLGQPDPQRLLDDRPNVLRLVGQPLENFAPEACKIIKQNLRFFKLLNIEVRKKMFPILKHVYSLSLADHAKLDDKLSIITLAEVEQVYTRASPA